MCGVWRSVLRCDACVISGGLCRFVACGVGRSVLCGGVGRSGLRDVICVYVLCGVCLQCLWCIACMYLVAFQLFCVCVCVYEV